jgi:hypothetical protein
MSEQRRAFISNVITMRQHLIHGERKQQSSRTKRLD